MENIRAYTIVHNLKELAADISYIPADIMDNDESAEYIKKNGFTIFFKTDLSYEKVYELLQNTIFLKDMELYQLENDDKSEQEKESKAGISEAAKASDSSRNQDNAGRSAISNMNAPVQSMISVGVNKLDKLMDLVGEMVIAEAMVIQNPELEGLELEGFHKAANQLSKITNEIQDLVMSIRMVPLSTTFQRMNRIVRDMSRKLNKEVELRIIGEETEVDKNIIEHISDPLMHLVRNCIDHGLESPQERILKGKPRIGVVTLEAKNAGNDVLIIVRDDGRGLDRERILQKARENNLISQHTDELSDKEVFSLILLPGFSTKSEITEYSGRGVGMDVVKKNIEEIGGSIMVGSAPDKGTQITLKIPLTLAIIDGMIIRVGVSSFTIPTSSIRESFRPVANSIISDADGNELIMVRGEFYPVLRLHRGASTGGTEAISRIISQLPAGMPGIVIVQHIPPVFSRMFADRLNNSSMLEVKETSNGDYVSPGRVLIAPGNKHMTVKRVGDRYRVECFEGEKVNGHCPSVDVLFESVIVKYLYEG